MDNHNDKGRKTDMDISPPEKAARLGPGLHFKGDLHGEEDFVVEGRLQGKINLGHNSLFISHSGFAEAEIRAQNVTLLGQVVGNVYASGKVIIAAEGRMTGDISASTISISDGAQFKGSIKILIPTKG